MSVLQKYIITPVFWSVSFLLNPNHIQTTEELPFFCTWSSSFRWAYACFVTLFPSSLCLPEQHTAVASSFDLCDVNQLPNSVDRKYTVKYVLIDIFL